MCVIVFKPDRKLLIFHSYFPTVIRVVVLTAIVTPALATVTFIQQIPYEIPFFNIEIGNVNFPLTFDRYCFQCKAPCLAT